MCKISRLKLLKCSHNIHIHTHMFIQEECCILIVIVAEHFMNISGKMKMYYLFRNHVPRYICSLYTNTIYIDFIKIEGCLLTTVFMTKGTYILGQIP